MAFSTFGKIGQGRRADIRAMGVAEIEQHDLAAIVGGADGLPSLARVEVN